jgi:hypothetical protein
MEDEEVGLFRALSVPQQDLDEIARRIRLMRKVDGGRLLLAVYFDAITTYLNRSERTGEWRDAATYIGSGRTDLFSFSYISWLLGLNPEYLRVRLRHYRAASGGRRVRARQNVRRDCISSPRRPTKRGKK